MYSIFPQVWFPLTPKTAVYVPPSFGIIILLISQPGFITSIGIVVSATPEPT